MELSESKVINKYQGRFVESHERCPICMRFKKDFIDPETGKIDFRYSPMPCECEDHLKMLKDTWKSFREVYAKWFNNETKPQTHQEEKHFEWMISVQKEIDRIERIVWENQQGGR